MYRTVTQVSLVVLDTFVWHFFSLWHTDTHTHVHTHTHTHTLCWMSRWARCVGETASLRTRTFAARGCKVSGAASPSEACRTSSLSRFRLGCTVHFGSETVGFGKEHDLNLKRARGLRFNSTQTFTKKAVTSTHRDVSLSSALFCWTTPSCMNMMKENQSSDTLGWFEPKRTVCWWSR